MFMAEEDRMKKIVSMPQQEYEELLANLIVKYYRPGFDEIQFNLRDKNRLSLMRFIVMLNAKFKATGRVVPLLKIAAQTADIQGGFVLADGTNTIDCTLATLLQNDESLLPV